MPCLTWTYATLGKNAAFFRHGKLTTFQSKDKAADKIKAELQDLAKKTTFLWLGMFASNFWAFPMMIPTELVSTPFPSL